MSFKIVRNDITKMNTEAIVNTASNQPTVGPGCDLAVYTAAGYEELLKYRETEIGCVEEGHVFITPGFKLPAKYIIHAVSPFYNKGEDSEEEKLRSCYRLSLALAKEHAIQSISFPLISTGSFGYPREEGMRIALDEINGFLLHNEMDIYLVVFDTQAAKLGKKVYPDLEAYIDHNYVLSKHEEEYGDPYFDSNRKRDKRYEADAEDRSAFAKRLQRNTRSVSREMAPVCVPYEIECVERSEDTEGFLEEDYEDRLDSLKIKLDEKKAHLCDTFSQYLLYLIAERGMKNADVYKRAIVDKKLFAKIKNDPSYHPQKLTCLCLCIGVQLNLDETKDLLSRAGYALSPCDMRDVIFSYFIENQIYDMVELDITLEEYEIPCIIV